jgi:transposase
MLGSEDFMVIQALVQRGVYLCDIAQQLGVHPRTVRRALQGGGPPRRRGGRRGSVLDPYRPAVDQLLTEGVWNAVVIWRELQAKGYSGGVSILRDYMRPKRALRPSRATVRFETEPGRQLQTDWATLRTVIAGQEVDVHFLVSTLSYSPVETTIRLTDRRAPQWEDRAWRNPRRRVSARSRSSPGTASPRAAAA